MHLKFNDYRLWIFQQAVIGSEQFALRRFVDESKLRSFAAALIQRILRSVLAEILIGAIAAQHVRSAHSADATMMAVL